MAVDTVSIDKYIVFRGYPLLRCSNNFMAYGDLNGHAFAEIVILGEQGGAEYPGMTMVTIKSTAQGNEVLRPNEFKNGLWEALEYSYEQIERFNKKN